MASPLIGLQAANYDTFPSKERAGSPCATTKSLSSDGPAAPGAVRFNDASASAPWEEPAAKLKGISTVDRVVESFRRAAVWVGIHWTTACIMIAINHSAGYVLLAPLLLYSLSQINYYSRNCSDLPSREERRRAQLGAHNTGRHDSGPRNLRPILTFAAQLAVVSCFGVFGAYETRQELWGWPLDFKNIPMSTRLVLWMWFAGFPVLVLLSVAGLILLASCLVCLVGLCKAYETFKGPEPAKRPPKVPKVIEDHLGVIDCILSYTAGSVAFIFIICSDLYKSSILSWISAAVITLCIGWNLGQHMRLAWRVDQFRLCIDWATDVDCVPVDPQLIEQLAYTDMIYRKRATIPYFLFPLGFFGQFIAIGIERRNHRILLSLAVAQFMLLYFGIWAVWKRGWFIGTPRTTQPSAKSQ